jgi:hypothetical protein
VTQYHVYARGRCALIHDDGITMTKYEKIDVASVANARRVAMVEGRAPTPKLKCNFCGHVVGKGALWCSTDCAKDYEAERRMLTTEGG